MKRLLACLVFCASLSTSAQVVYPYNPDANGDSLITSGDLLDFLPVFASSFTPQVITIDGLPLDEWLANLEGVVNSNAASIESLFAMQAQINALQASNGDLQNQINSLQNQLDNLSFSFDGLPPCVDIDTDEICDYADVCAGVSIEFLFNYQNESASCLEPGGQYFNADLSEVNLSGAYLANINLSFASLFSNDLSNTILSNANLSDANLANADLSGADMTGADLSGAQLSIADLTGAILFGTNFSGADLSGANLEYADLSGSDLTGANLSGAYLLNADLSGAYLLNADLFDANLSYAYLTGANLLGANLSGASINCCFGCPSSLPSGYICEPDLDCSGQYRIVPE